MLRDVDFCSYNGNGLDIFDYLCKAVLSFIVCWKWHIEGIELE